MFKKVCTPCLYIFFHVSMISASPWTPPLTTYYHNKGSQFGHLDSAIIVTLNELSKDNDMGFGVWSEEMREVGGLGFW